MPTNVMIPSSRKPEASIALSVFEAVSPSKIPTPVIILAHGIGAVRASALPIFAKAFTEVGYHAVTLDYLHWGDSGGEPRHILDVKGQFQDFKDVITWVRSQPNKLDISRLVVWGSSFGGMHITALLAEDHDIAAGIAQCPCVDGLAASMMTPLSRKLRLARDGLKDLWSQWTTGEVVYVQQLNDGSCGSPAAIMVEPDAIEIRRRLAPQDDTFYPNAIGALSLFQFGWNRPKFLAHKIIKPYLIVLPTVDAEAPLGAAEEVVLNAPLGEGLRVDGGHFDLYPGAPSYEANIKGQISFLRRVLK